MGLISTKQECIKQRIVIPTLDAADNICSSYMDLSNPKYIIIDDLYFSSLIVINYSHEMEPLFLDRILSLDVNANLSMYYLKQNTYDVIKELYSDTNTNAVSISKNLKINLNGCKLTTTELIKVTGGTAYIYGSGTVTSSSKVATLVVAGGTLYFASNGSTANNTSVTNTHSCGEGIALIKGTLNIGLNGSASRSTVAGTCYGVYSGVNSTLGTAGAKTLNSYYSQIKVTGSSTSSAGIMFDDTSNTTTAYLSGTNVYGYGMGIQKKAPGTLTITGNSDGASRIESKASYTIHQSGGTITLGNGAATGTGETSVILGDHATSASALYLSGGTMNYGQNTAIYAKGSNGSVMPVTIAGATMNLQGGVIRSIQSGGSSFNRTNC